MAERSPAILANRSTLALVSRHARESLPLETGGILIGWREGARIAVQDFLVVPDDEAGRCSYVRQHQTARDLLADYVHDADDARLGYVGEWHSHPSPQPASSTDLASIIAIGKQVRAPIALMVLMAAVDRSRVDIDARVVRRRALRTTTERVPVGIL